ncbi:MAG: type II toxin-antitoxin system VapC family toxin [Bacteroidota bacterium]|nr:type II toxin-antitoxin system VapC family toxin [Bacteroidota bacterium]
MILCDTNIIIDLLKFDNELVKQNYSQIGAKNLAINPIIFAEIFRGIKKNESKIVLKHLSAYNLLKFTPEVTDIFIELIRKYAHSHNNDSQIPDLLIAATAIHYNCELYTKNIKDFTFIEELKIYNPIE